ncbi:MAG TPA: hypothetical protein VKT75_16605 [Acidobacteriaceae bacterium]|jgi:hypothetical protein|nr:hypothetical protein [Acidobacteriaceae bacterium]
MPELQILQMRCPKTLRSCPGPGTCPGCKVHAALQGLDAEEVRKKLMLLWEGQPMKATDWRQLMRDLGISEEEARELECQQQCIVDQEIARFPKAIQ